MDHMRISGNEPLPVILTKTKKLKSFEFYILKVLKQAEAKRENVIHPQNYNFNQF